MALAENRLAPRRFIHKNDHNDRHVLMEIITSLDFSICLVWFIALGLLNSFLCFLFLEKVALIG